RVCFNLTQFRAHIVVLLANFSKLMATAANQEIGGMESFAALFEESLSRQDMRSGEVISAEVVRLDHNFVIVNAGLKSEAFIPIEEFKNDQGELEVKVGDFVSVA